MAVVMMIASLPTIGVIIVADRSGPTISLDICHPIQSLGASTSSVPIARPAQPELGATILSHQTLAQFVPILKSKPAETPDPPPPRLFC